MRWSLRFADRPRMESPMARLFSYIVRYDDGAAPNPYGGPCTLVICKPRVRSTAQVEDWIAGVGSVNSPGGSLKGRLVYAMKVEEVVSMRDYDRRAKNEWPEKVPGVSTDTFISKRGDCIYDFSEGDEPTQRPGVHGEGNVARDLSGKNALISTRFVYFGANAIEIPHTLSGICPTTQGHRSNANGKYLEDFTKWIEAIIGDGKRPQRGSPGMANGEHPVHGCGTCLEREEGDDEEEGDAPFSG